MAIPLPEPMTAVLSVLRQHEVRSLLMGGQACVIYGASEFSRDIDIVVYADPANLERLARALVALDADVTAHAMSSDRDRALDAGCDDYDTKPIDLARLLGKVEALLNPARGPEPAEAAGAS